MDELFAFSVDTGSKRPGQPASDVAETKRKKENTEVREGERGMEREGKGEGERERGEGREGMDELFAFSVDTGSKRPGQPASDVAETKRKKENTEVREGERGMEREGKGEGERERGEGREGVDELFALTVEADSKRPGQPASDVAETKRKKENTEVREGEGEGDGKRGKGGGKERGGRKRGNGRAVRPLCGHW